MAALANKRRKLEHASSDDDEDDASFASFGDDDADESDVEEDASEDAGSHHGGSEDEFDSQLGARENQPTRAQNPAKSPITPINYAPHAKPHARKPIAATPSSSTTTSIFSIQINDLLSQIRPRESKSASAISAEEALRNLRQTIEAIPSSPPLDVRQAELTLSKNHPGFSVPFSEPRPPADAKYKLQYSQPPVVNVAGSHALKTASRVQRAPSASDDAAEAHARDEVEIVIDMLLTMPRAIFQEKDYLNHRYFYKKAYWIACLAATVEKKHGREYSFVWKEWQDDSLKPILVVEPRAESGAEARPVTRSWRINIIPSVPSNTFPSSKLHPDANNLRPHTTDVSSTKDSASTAASTTVTAASFYNSSLQADTLQTAYHNLLHQTCRRVSAFRDACVLGHAWSRQRNMGSRISKGGFGHFEWNVLAALLLVSGGPGGRGLLGDSWNAEVLFKSVLRWLAGKDLEKDRIVLGSENSSKASGNAKDRITNSPARTDGLVMLWDSARSHNLFYKMTPWSYSLLRHEAKNALTILADATYDQAFDTLFVSQSWRESAFKYDVQFTFDFTRIATPASAQHRGRTSQPDCEKLYDVLRRGLGDRITQLHIALPDLIESWPLNRDVPPAGSKRPGVREVEDLRVAISIVLNPHTAYRIIDQGPSAEQKADAASFRAFWGEKAELRRFADGRILECVVWDAAGKSTVVEQIIRFVVGRHLGLAAEEGLRLREDGLNAVIARMGMAMGAPLTSSKAFKTDAFAKFENDLRAMDLPLSIKQILPADAQLRHTSSQHRDRQRAPANVTLQFEDSPRWPEDLVAIQRTKIAFLLNLVERLLDPSATADIMSARVGLENPDLELCNQGFLEVVYSSGAAFRVRIYYEREGELLEKRVKDPTKTLGPREREIAAMVLAKWRRDYTKAPAFTAAVARLTLRFPALTGTIALLKKWFASHLLANRVPVEIIEMLAIRTFAHPWPWGSEPGTPRTGFLRSLHFIAGWNWRVDPLIVDLSSGTNALKAAEVRAIRSRFEAWRKLDHALGRVVLFCASDVDPEGVCFSEGQISKVVAGRMTALARAAVDLLDCSPVMNGKGDWTDGRALFASGLQDFDFVLHLQPEKIGRSQNKRKAIGTHSMNGDGGTLYKNLEIDTQSSQDPTQAGYDPSVLFLQDLELLYGDSVLFFSSSDERPIIAGLWDPAATAERNWRLGAGFSTLPVSTQGTEGEVKARVNRQAVLAEIARLGGDLIVKVEEIK